MTADQFFYTHPVFRLEDFTAFKAKQGTTNPASIRQALQYYLNAERIAVIRRGLYAVISPDQTRESLVVDPFLIASKTSADSVLAYHTALELHGVAYSVFNQFTFLTRQKVKAFIYQDQRFQPVLTPQILLKKNAVNFGVVTIDRGGLNIRATDLARSFVDTLARVDLCGGWEEVVRSLNKIAILDIEKVIAYSLKLDSPVICAKVGFFLERRQGAFAVNNKTLKRLLTKKLKSPHYLIKSRREPNQFVKKWNLMVPLSILNETWEEPLHDV